MQPVDAADLAQHCLGQLHAVIDLRGGGQVQQHAGELAVMGLDVDAANQVGSIFLVGQPARCSR